MKLFRHIAIVLILALASSPALAAVCATSCASQALMASFHSNSMSGMKNCQESSVNKDKSTSDAEHKSCEMGAGCHFTQVTPINDSSMQYAFAELSNISFPRFVPFEKSIDLSPPLKPPA